MSSRRSALFLSLLLVALTAMALSFVGCTKEIGADCDCLVPGTVQPSATQVQAEQLRACEATLQEIVDKQLPATRMPLCSTAWLPRVEFRPCPFVVHRSTFGTDVCAAGLTLHDDHLIVVSLAEPARVLPLVGYETRNYVLIECGLGKLAV